MTQIDGAVDQSQALLKGQQLSRQLGRQFDRAHRTLADHHAHVNGVRGVTRIDLSGKDLFANDGHSQIYARDVLLENHRRKAQQVKPSQVVRLHKACLAPLFDRGEEGLEHHLAKAHILDEATCGVSLRRHQSAGHAQADLLGNRPLVGLVVRRLVGESRIDPGTTQRIENAHDCLRGLTDRELTPLRLRNGSVDREGPNTPPPHRARRSQIHGSLACVDAVRRGLVVSPFADQRSPRRKVGQINPDHIALHLGQTSHDGIGMLFALIGDDQNHGAP